jgi:hypothetical protein
MKKSGRWGEEEMGRYENGSKTNSLSLVLSVIRAKTSGEGLTLR